MKARQTVVFAPAPGFGWGRYQSGMNLTDLPLYMRRLAFCKLVDIGATTFNEWRKKGHFVVVNPSPRMSLVYMPSAIAFLQSLHAKKKTEDGGDE